MPDPKRLAVIRTWTCFECDCFSPRIDGGFDCEFHRLTDSFVGQPVCAAAYVGWGICWKPSGLQWKLTDEEHWELVSGTDYCGNIFWVNRLRLWKIAATRFGIWPTNSDGATLHDCACALVAAVRGEHG